MFFSLELLAKAVEMKKLQIEHKQAKNEELRLKQSTPTAELRQFEFGGIIDGKKEEGEEMVLKNQKEKPKSELFNFLSEIFDPNKNAEIISKIEKDIKEGKGEVIIGVDLGQEKDDCPCPACELRRRLESQSNGLN